MLRTLCLKKWFCVLVLVLALVPLVASASSDRIPRLMILGDSWPSFICTDDAFGQAFINKGLPSFDWARDAAVALAGSEIYEWGDNTGKAKGALQHAAEYLAEHPKVDIVFVTLGGNDFLGRWKPTSTPEEVEQIWYEAKFGTDGNHGLKLIIDTILAVRSDIKVIFSSYDYIGYQRERWTMEEVQAYNTANEAYSAMIIDFINDYYKNPPRAFFVNNLGLMQYTFGYPGPNVDSIPSYFWPLDTEGGTTRTPHGFHFNAGPAAVEGDPPLFPGNEASGYTPLAGGDPDFRISPYYAQLEPPLDGWIHLSPPGYLALAENCIDQYIGEWLKYPKVYSVALATLNPLEPGQVYNPVNESKVAFTVTFSEPVTGVDESDFETVEGGNVSHTSVDSVTESKDGEEYTVIVNRGVGDGSLGLAVIDNGSIKNAANYPLGGTRLDDGYFGSSEIYTIDSNHGLPVFGWPAALLLLAGGALKLRKQK